MLKIDTKFFFNSAAVINATDKAARQVLSRFGAFVRRSARSSIRKRRKPSAPGQPPSAHGTLLKLILFAWQPATRSVVAGPMDVSGKAGETPATLESGGRNIIREKGRPDRMGHYQARPFMGPALQQNLPSLPAMWRDSVKP